MKRLEGLKAAVGEGGYLDDPEAMAPYLEEWRGRYRSETPLVLLPSSTREVAGVVAECGRHGIGIVPQGGNTGLCGGAVAGGEDLQVILSLRRLDRIRELSTAGDFLIAEAGCVLADLQAAADEAGRLFPLSLAAEGSCQIGGNLSTDAGGINVLRYGTARQQVLGLEVVLADGRVWDGLRTLRKNTAGYDLRDLFIGAEGTLGIITAAALRLHPRPGDVATAMIAIDGPGRAVALLEAMRARLGEEISAFELISGRALEFVLAHIADTRHPFDEDHPAYVLMESTANSPGDAMPRLEAALEAALDEGLLRDAVAAGDGRRRDALWRLRHSISEAQRHEGVSLKHDISVPVERIGEFLERAGAALAGRFPEARLVVFGHVGDGNLHYNLSQPVGADPVSFRAAEPEVNGIVFDTVHACGGSFSAEHGVGLLRREQMRRYLDDTELDLMRRLKTALDPAGILNPGKVL
ncbi:FAD-binding oxidoreductase [Lentisalinibacter salinarum]|uniref:FAD-binding oxidoreductase n=1 Tax=Lentisalinibacter salinarum TaxID=2992239 RepID=UPI0038686374